MYNFLSCTFLSVATENNVIHLFLWIYLFSRFIDSEDWTDKSDKPTSNDTNFQTHSSDRQSNLDMMKVMWRTSPKF